MNLCRNGHKMTKANTILTKRGHRECRQCRRLQRFRWLQTPTGQAWRERSGARRQTPEYKARQRAYNQARQRRGFREG